MKKPATTEFACACAALRQASRLVTQIYEEELREHLAVPQFTLLSVLHALPGCNQATLACQFDFDKTTLSRNLKLLEKNGWIEHTTSDDQRERGYRLTRAGSKLLAAAKPGWKRAQSRLRAAMTGSEWRDMWQTLGNLTEAARSVRITAQQ
jgi:DNA-binding MarR family transcriptional regulator